MENAGRLNVVEFPVQFQSENISLRVGDIRYPVIFCPHRREAKTCAAQVDRQNFGIGAEIGGFGGLLPGPTTRNEDLARLPRR